MSVSEIHDVPFLSASVPPSGGRVKSAPEDFVVEELPAYEPCGEGEHLFLWIEKRARTTSEVARQLAQQAGLQEREVSWAGLKDRQAVTRQYLCVPARAEARCLALALDGARVLRASRHRNKLKSGHLRGNRFEIVLRDVRDLRAAQESLELIARLGLPNAFGAQRFGRHGENAARGRRILERGGKHGDRFERKLFLSAYQSALFNAVLARRIEAGLFSTALEGDVLKKHATGGEFVCVDPPIDQPRCDAFEISPTGPLFGPSMRAAEHEPGAVEEAVLREQGVTAALFAAGGGETSGARRFLRVPVAALEAKCDPSQALLRLSFELPAGSYATVLLRELLKDEPLDDGGPGTVTPER